MIAIALVVIVGILAVIGCVIVMAVSLVFLPWKR
jgi:hypothetical protein